MAWAKSPASTRAGLVASGDGVHGDAEAGGSAAEDEDVVEIVEGGEEAGAGRGQRKARGELRGYLNSRACGDFGGGDPPGGYFGWKSNAFFALRLATGCKIV